MSRLQGDARDFPHFPSGLVTPRIQMKPAKPVESAAAERRVEELLRDVQFALSRMEAKRRKRTASSGLVGQLRELLVVERWKLNVAQPTPLLKWLVAGK